MTMATIQSKISRGNKYWYIVESRRVNGKPRPVVLAYLGKACDLLKRLQGVTGTMRLKSYSHGSVAALLKIANELNVPAIINKYIDSQRSYMTSKPTRNNLTAGFTFLLAAIGRACVPTSKRAWWSWARTTSCEYLLRCSLSKIDSQHFWDLMDALPIKAKVETKLQELQKALSNPKGKKRNKEKLEAKIEKIINVQFIKELMSYSLTGLGGGKYELNFTTNHEKLHEIELTLGFRILMTNRHNWSTEEIIKAYYGQSMIENAFKNLKNPYHLALRPQYHWTDQKIKVHFFICVLGYLLSSIVYKQAKTGAEFKGTLDTLLDVLNNVRLATMLEDSETRGRVKAIYKLEEMTKEEKSIVESLGIENIHNDRIKFNGVGVYT